ncbi:pyridoxamine 5'-phosphate oxidase family protein [Geodermatophilus sp. URMC 60]|jgi:hypothetical protein
MPTTGPDRVVVPLGDAECRALLLGGRIGRLAFTRNALPAIQPVSYRMHDGEVVIPALPDSPFAPRAWGAVVAFGVDSYDDSTPTGWSVTVVGPSRSVHDPAAVAVLDTLPWPAPGATCGHRYVAVRIGMLSGWRTETRAG